MLILAACPSIPYTGSRFRDRRGFRVWLFTAERKALPKRSSLWANTSSCAIKAAIEKSKINTNKNLARFILNSILSENGFEPLTESFRPIIYSKSHAEFDPGFRFSQSLFYCQRCVLCELCGAAITAFYARTARPFCRHCADRSERKNRGRPACGFQSSYL